MENADTHAGELSPSFVCALTDAQFDLLAFICMLLGNRDMAQDVLQDTNLRLISHSAEYDTRRPFLPWAKAFAYNQVRTFVKKSARSRLVFDEGLVDALAEETPCVPAESKRELEMLDDCVARLTPAQRELIEAHYYRNQRVERIAGTLGRSVISVYVHIHRIRRLLGACIEAKLQAAESAGGGS